VGLLKKLPIFAIRKASDFFRRLVSLTGVAPCGERSRTKQAQHVEGIKILIFKSALFVQLKREAQVVWDSVVEDKYCE
jgi:hypothetical protein